MRWVDAGLENFLKAGEGIESCLVMSIDNGFRWYGDKTIGVYFNEVIGKIISCSPIESIMRMDRGGAGAGQVTVTLDNTDNEFDYAGIASYVFKPVIFRQIFYSRDLDGTIVKQGQVDIYKGHITTPLRWSESERTITFTVFQAIKSQEAGYTVDEIFGATNPDAIRLFGVPCPMIFGHVAHSPCLKLTASSSIWTTQGFGLVDKTIQKQIAKLESQKTVIGPIYDWGTESVSPPFVMVGDWTPSPEAESQLSAARQAQEQNAKIDDDIKALQHEYENQIRLSNMYGSGDIPLQLDAKLTTAPGSCTVRVDNLVFPADIPKGQLQGKMKRHTVQGPGETFQQWIAEGFKWVRAGSRVQIVTPYPVWYIASVTPGEIKTVFAKRSTGGSHALTPVPKDWYTTKSIGKANCVILNMPLSARDWLMEQQRIHFENLYGKYLPIHINQPFDWEDDIWVEYNGTIGPSVVSVIDYILNFAGTSVRFDLTGDAYEEKARAQMGHYQCNFMIAVKEDAFKLANDIAYQVNAILYMKNDQVMMRYLPIPSSTRYEIKQSEMLYGSLNIETSNLDEIITRMTATCRLDYSPYFDKPVTVRARNNVEKFGLISESHDYFALTDPAAVLTSIGYWLSLYSVLRTRIIFKAMPWHIKLEALDFCDTPYGVGIVYSASYDSTENVNNIAVDIYPNLGIGVMDKNMYWPDYVTVDPGGGGEPAGGETRPPMESIPGVSYNYVWPENIKIALDKGANAPYFPPSEDFVGIPYPESEPFTPDVPQLSNNYQYNDYKPISIPETPHFFVAPCVVKKGSKDTYAVTAYPNGTGGEGMNLSARQLQIASDDVIPEGSWGFVVGIRDKDKKWHYYIQYPVWLA